jgi:hypothetical protein
VRQVYASTDIRTLSEQLNLQRFGEPGIEASYRPAPFADRLVVQRWTSSARHDSLETAASKGVGAQLVGQCGKIRRQGIPYGSVINAAAVGGNQISHSSDSSPWNV